MATDTEYRKAFQARMRAAAGLPPVQTARHCPDPCRIISAALAAPRPTNPTHPPCNEDTP